METAQILEVQKESKLNVVGLEAIAEKFARINRLIEAGEELPSDLTKNFITLDLSADPFTGIE